MKTLFAFLISFSSFAQIATGEWRLHVSSSSTVDVAANSEVVYAAFKNGLMEYDISSGDINSWNKVNALSDVSLTSLFYSETQNALFIGYENGNLDFLKDNQVTNIPALRLADIPGDKSINKIVEHDGLIYLATGFSIVVINPIKLEVKDTYYPTNGSISIEDIAFTSDSIFALTEKSILKANLNNTILADFAQWSIDTRVPEISEDYLTYKDIQFVYGEKYILQKSNQGYGQDSVFCITNSGLEFVSGIGEQLEIYSLGTFTNLLVVNIDGGILFGQKITDGMYNLAKNFSIGGSGVINSVIVSENKAWAGDFYNGGVYRYENGGATRIKSS